MRVGLLLPPDPDWGWLSRAAGLAELLTEVAGWTVAIGLPEDANWSRRASQFYRPSSVTVRRLTWRPHGATMLREVFGSECGLPSGVTEAVVPHDWGWTFRDCDVWLLCADAGLGAVAMLRPTLVYCRGLDQRYAPTVFADRMDNPVWERQVAAFLGWRQARSVVVTNPANVTDVVSYAGVRREFVNVLPPLPLCQPNGSTADRNQLLWLTGHSARHDRATAEQALRRWRNAGSARPIRVASLGKDAVPEMPQLDDCDVQPREPDFFTERSIDGAAVVFSDAIVDGEADAALLAAQSGRVYVGPDTPQSRWVRDELGATSVLYRIGDAAAAVSALTQAEDTPVPRPLVIPPAGDQWRTALAGLTTGAE